MSSILKALKKLEHEKTSRFPDPLHIDSDILRASDSSRGFSPFVTTLLLLLVFGGGAAVAYFFMNGTKAPLVASKPQPVITATNIQRPLSPPVVHTETLPAEIIVVPARKKPSGEALHKQPQKTAAFKKVAQRITKKPTKTNISGNSEKSKEATEKTIKKEIPAVATVPALRVNGIAFQSGSADNMAIVNGTPVSNGSTIDNATVEEIRKDRVLFQRNGEKFEIQLGQSNR